MFTRSFLKEMYTKFEQYKAPAHTPKLASDVIKLPQTAELASLFASMVPYFDPNVKHYTGRSLATFKRDFKKVSDLTPEKWLIRKRLEVAYDLMKQGGRKIADVYTEVGFKNQSHFSTAFKKLYGIPPTSVSALS